jgi:hypothetical protein
MGAFSERACVQQKLNLRTLSEVCQRCVDYTQLFVEYLYRRTGVDATWRPILKLLAEPLPMCAKVLERVPILKAQIAADN